MSAYVVQCGSRGMYIAPGGRRVNSITRALHFDTEAEAATAIAGLRVSGGTFELPWRALRVTGEEAAPAAQA